MFLSRSSLLLLLTIFKISYGIIPTFNEAKDGIIDIFSRTGSYGEDTESDSGKGELNGDKEDDAVDMLLNRIRKGEYKFELGQRFKVSNSTMSNISSEYMVYEVKLDGDKDCLGFDTDALETIVLQCSDQKEEEEPGCFDIFTRKKAGSNIISPTGKEKKICVQKINRACVGLIMLDNSTVILDCQYLGHVVSAPGITEPPKS